MQIIPLSETELIQQEYSKVSKLFEFYAPKVVIICGTGLSRPIIDALSIEKEISFQEFESLGKPTVDSHSGSFFIGKLNKVSTVVISGRLHFYEGFDMNAVVRPLRLVLSCPTIQSVFISNAAGGINQKYSKGDLVFLYDHLNLFGSSPLIGPNYSTGFRFPDLSSPYCLNLIDLAQHICLKNNFKSHLGIYAGVFGPALETPAEYRMLQIMGADLVGMSTIPEVIAAKQLNKKVFCVSVITDLATNYYSKPTELSEIIATANEAAPKITTLFNELISYA